MMIVYNSDSVTIQNLCMFTDTVEQMTFEVNPQEFADGYALWQSGEPTQVAFPFLTADQREFLMTGTTPVIWDEYFAELEN
jgi:hypothetical protein